MGAQITTAQIKQQPTLWQTAFANYTRHKTKITAFLLQVTAAANGQTVRVIFTGAGSSQYVGHTVTPYLRATGHRSKFTFTSLASTDIVSAP